VYLVSGSTVRRCLMKSFAISDTPSQDSEWNSKSAALILLKRAEIHVNNSKEE
jgi:hypothetical protein